ncbi:INO80 complex, subunit Ies [Trema orientale]|uniref:INO80 complex, subunit Ies n=1 Tax=Trema orientale TaxID=63057 RepID=A0A2P5DGI6_TREOI|nr:INO80 complex, subunit Ies [Trema orientale]
MEEFGPAARFDGISNAVRKKRSQASRRPRPDSQPNAEINDDSPMSSTPPSDDAHKASSDDNGGFDSNSNGKEFSLNQCVSMVSPSAGVEGDKLHRTDGNDGGFNSYYSNESGRSGFNVKRSSEGVLAPANWKSANMIKDGVESESRNADVFSGWNGESSNSRQLGVLADGFGNDNKVKKVKLKVGGVTHTIQANSAANGVSGVADPSSKGSRPSDDSRLRHKHGIQANYDDNISPLEKRSGLQGIPWKDFSRGGFSLGRDDSVMGKVSRKNTSGREEEKSEPVRKSKRVPKKRVAAVYREDDEEFGRKHRKLSTVSNVENGGASRSGKDGKKKSRIDRVSGDNDYDEDEESASDGELDGKKKRKKQRKESIDSLMEGRRETTLTTRQRALQSSKDASSTPGAGFIEFPNGLPPAPPRKQKEKLTDVEQQLKKAEAAQRRRMQVEKAARESEAEAIRKILGQDSNRKKREDKIKKRQEELAQEKAASALLNASNTIRWVMGPTGTVVTFSKDMGLPSIFDPKPCSYPPPRESCAGPLCNNPYKYRDSKSKLPLCSLQCYKAVQAKMLAETTC